MTDDKNGEPRWDVIGADMGKAFTAHGTCRDHGKVTRQDITFATSGAFALYATRENGQH